MVATSIKEIWNLVASPEKAGAKHLEKLNLLVEEYPYCQTLQLLYTKSLKEAEDIHFIERLKLTAIYAADRKKLNQLLMVEKPNIEVFQQIMIPSTLYSKDEEGVIFEKKNLSTPNDELTSNDLDIDSKERVMEPSADIKEIPIFRIISNSFEFKELDLSKESSEKLKAKDLQATKEQESATSIVAKNDISSIKTIIDESPLEREILTEAINKAREIYTEETYVQKEAIAPLQNQDEPKTKSISILENPKAKTLSFSDWLMNDSFDSPEQKFAVNDLIDRFITTSPQLTPPKREFFSPINLGKKSLLEDDSMVTETLANIYMAQNEFDKAINAYKTLRLKYPEKITYFAAQIKKAQELKNKKNK
jgi:hypothetical protein